ncbi:hypothetical protein HETIRDRAFT_163329 [Heterobasidion irregulare TC 32-1]|uniref:Uncharacterized protein n=1 Tax=Heterobasidion irregulare (strain TC 32-1) TaxID=747525 RepID=W4KAR2_HETIT|nr:uncharacterized protein HETIRDRAFT_163329 [Heterobasidion irregulare TC 32-1]ETW82917.1 hypothetical protein HETIRDRAFT_163329 [Heterobasidion irregulare TC 32-1]
MYTIKEWDNHIEASQSNSHWEHTAEMYHSGTISGSTLAAFYIRPNNSRHCSSVGNSLQPSMERLSSIHRRKGVPGAFSTLSTYTGQPIVSVRHFTANILTLWLMTPSWAITWMSGLHDLASVNIFSRDRERP